MFLVHFRIHSIPFFSFDPSNSIFSELLFWSIKKLIFRILSMRQKWKWLMIWNEINHSIWPFSHSSRSDKNDYFDLKKFIVSFGSFSFVSHKCWLTCHLQIGHTYIEHWILFGLSHFKCCTYEQFTCVSFKRLSDRDWFVC